MKVFLLDYTKRNHRKIFHLSVELSAGDSDIDEAFKSMHQSIMTKMKNSASEIWIVVETILKHSSNIFECAYITGDNK